jgi:CHAT domain-containing protein/tetratricopeptide (TPR) repeat protein
MPIAHEIERLGVRAHAPELQALGAMTAADALREQGRYPEALREYDRAGLLYLSVDDEVGWARTRLGSAYARATTVELGPALEEAERARAILRKHGLWVRLARLESAMGNLLRELGRTQEALQAHRRATQAANQVTDDAERELVCAEVRINHAVVYQRLDQYEHAETLLRDAIETFRRHERPGPVAVAEGNLARGLAAQGHVSRALAQAIDVRRTTLALGRTSHAAIFGQVAVECLLELNRPAEAASLADELVEQLAACEAGVELAKSLLQRAIARARLERFSEAADDLASAEHLFRIGGCEGWAAVVRLQHAQALERTAALEAALDEALEAGRELRQRGLIVQSARADLVRARVLFKLNQPGSALRAARSARAVARRSGVPLLEYAASRLIGEFSADDPAALRAFAAAAAALEKSQGRILTEQRAGFLQLEDKLSVYASAIRLCIRGGDTQRAFLFAERAKARALVDALALRARGVPMRPNTPAARALAEELMALRRRYDRLSSTAFEPRPQDDLGASAVSGHAMVLQRELEECEAKIGAVMDDLRLTEASSVDQLAELQGKVRLPLRYLGADTALVQYAIVEDDLLIFVLRRGKPVVVRSAAAGGALQVVRLLRMFDLNLRTVMSGRRLPQLEQQAKALLERLHALLIGPIRDLIAPYRRLVVVPQGALHGVPFAALYDGAQYAIERFELVLAPSATAIAFCRRKRVRTAGDRALVIAHSADGRLPGAVAEGETIADVFHAKRLFEAEASIENVREHLAGASLVHIAAHGRSRKDAPLFSHLRLADGQLTALDCLDLPLDCELVTLSACETSHGSVAAGDEPIGLTRSLLYAGARSVIQSLWRVDDDATRHLMSDLYQRLRNGAGRAEALRAAQLECLAEQSSSWRAHPAFWAAFGVVGDWRPLQ